MTAAPAIERHAPGTFCWAELVTTDPEGAKAFYTPLFHWSAEDLPIGGGEAYTMWKTQGLEHSAMYRIPASMAARKVPPHWLLYVCVEDVDATAHKASASGAVLLVPPTGVQEHGRMAVIQDPQGAVFALWQPKQHTGAKIMNTVGTLCWSELATRDTQAALSFYKNLFSWKGDTKKSGPPGMQIDYTEWIAGGAHIGGMLEMTDEWGDAPPNWMPYFQVTDCLETVEKAKKLGGKVEFGPLPIENVGSFALIADPQGAYFYAIELSMVA